MYDLDSSHYESNIQGSSLESTGDIGIRNIFIRAIIDGMVITILPDDGDHLNIRVEGGEGYTHVLDIKQFVGYAIAHNFPSEAADLLTLAFIESRDTNNGMNQSITNNLSDSPIFSSAIFEGHLASSAIREALEQRGITTNDDPEFIRLVGLVTHLKVSAYGLNEEIDGRVNISKQSSAINRTEAASSGHNFICNMVVNGEVGLLNSHAGQNEIENVILWAKEHGVEEQLAEVLVEMFVLKHHPMKWMAFMERYTDLNQREGYAGRTVDALHRFRHLGVANYTIDRKYIIDLIDEVLPGYLSRLDIDPSLSNVQEDYMMLRHNLLMLLDEKRRHDPSKLESSFSLMPIKLPMAEHSFRVEYPLPTSNSIKLRYRGNDGSYYTVIVELDGETPRVLFNDITNCPNPDELIFTLIFLVNEHMKLVRCVEEERSLWKRYDYRKFDIYNWGHGDGIEYSDGKGVGLRFVVDDQDKYEQDLPLGMLKRIYAGRSLERIVSALQDNGLLDYEHRGDVRVFSAMLRQLRLPKMRGLGLRKRDRLDIKDVEFSIVSK